MRVNIIDFNALKVEVSMVYIQLREKDYSLT
jgi:hypothetical protein